MIDGRIISLYEEVNGLVFPPLVIFFLGIL